MSSERTMRYWVFDGPRRIHQETKPVPEPGPGEARLRVARAGICGSDVHGYSGESGLRVPGVVMGHEATAIVDALGPGVEEIAVGEPVTFAPTMPCTGACGHTVENRCEQLRLVGVAPEWQGAFADYMVLPARRIFPLGSLSLDLGIAIEPMAVGLHSARRAGVEAGDRVLVLGGGMIGQAAAQAARMEGAETVTVSDPLADRRRIADASGFQGIDPDALEQMPPFDCAIDAVGIPSSFSAAVRVVARGGTVSLVGLGQPRVELTVYDLVGHERAVVGSSCYSDAEFRDALAAIADGRLDLDPLAPVEIGFDQLGDALEALVTGEERAIKVKVTVASDDS
jgi:2-desacetyl-2-hydroxyethyl bacteriochlorophyllide A dehydrogenase